MISFPFPLTKSISCSELVLQNWCCGSMIKLSIITHISDFIGRIQQRSTLSYLLSVTGFFFLTNLTDRFHHSPFLVFASPNFNHASTSQTCALPLYIILPSATPPAKPEFFDLVKAFPLFCLTQSQTLVS